MGLASHLQARLHKSTLALASSLSCCPGAQPSFSRCIESSMPRCFLRPRCSTSFPSRFRFPFLLLLVLVLVLVLVRRRRFGRFSVLRCVTSFSVFSVFFPSRRRRQWFSLLLSPFNEMTCKKKEETCKTLIFRLEEQIITQVISEYVVIASNGPRFKETNNSSLEKRNSTLGI